MNILSPSILSADFWKLGEQIRAVQEAGAQYLHVDVMDGMFVPSISFGMPVLRSIRKMTDLFLDVHLMIEKPERYIGEFAECGADMITLHIEAVEDVGAAVAAVRARGIRAGLTIRPGTPVSALKPYLHKVDMALIMTVEPGFGGQELIPACVDKVREVRELIRFKGLNVDVEVDGGVNAENVETLLAAGANVIVAGSAVFCGDICENVRKFSEKLGMW